MKRHARPSKAARNSDDADLGYEVGYGKPPTDTRFKPGQSGNPRGRPKHSRNMRAVIVEALSETVTIREGNRKRTVGKLEALVRTVVNKALMDDPKALQALLMLLRATGLIADEPDATAPEDLSPEDEVLIADFVRRHGGGS